MSSGSRTIGSLETYEPEDKSFSKHTLKEGTGDCLPNEGSVCIVTINLVGKYFVALLGMHIIQKYMIWYISWYSLTILILYQYYRAQTDSASFTVYKNYFIFRNKMRPNC